MVGSGQYYKNKPEPGRGGDTFDKHDSPVVAAEAWYGFPDGYEDIRGLRLKFEDGDELDVGRVGSDPPDSAYDFKQGEKVTEMNVWGHTDSVTGIPNGFVTGIEFRTTRTNRPQVLGVQEGQRFNQGLGNGRLVGFQGRAGFEVDAIGAIYED